MLMDLWRTTRSAGQSPVSFEVPRGFELLQLFVISGSCRVDVHGLYQTEVLCTYAAGNIEEGEVVTISFAQADKEPGLQGPNSFLIPGSRAMITLYTPDSAATVCLYGRYSAAGVGFTLVDVIETALHSYLSRIATVAMRVQKWLNHLPYHDAHGD